MADKVTPLERGKEAVSDSVDAARQAVSETIEGARERLEDVAVDVEKRVRKVSQEVRRGAEHAGEQVKKGYRQSVDSLREGYGRVRKDVGELSADVTEYVRDNPGKSVLMAAGVGFLLGLLIRARRDDV